MTQVSQFQSVFNLAGSGALESVADGFWGAATVIDDDLSLYNATDDSIDLDAVGWYDVGLSMASEDNDFAVSNILEIRIGRFHKVNSLETWFRWNRRGTVSVSNPKWTMRGAIFVPTANTYSLVIGAAQNSGTAKDLLIEVQVIA
jgi:hypothetical protein